MSALGGTIEIPFDPTIHELVVRVTINLFLQLIQVVVISFEETQIVRFSQPECRPIHSVLILEKDVLHFSDGLIDFLLLVLPSEFHCIDLDMLGWTERNFILLYRAEFAIIEDIPELVLDVVEVVDEVYEVMVFNIEL